MYGSKYEIDSIVVEMARDRNSEEERQRISDANKANVTMTENIVDKFKDNGIVIDKCTPKHKLLLQQKCIDPYDGKKISMEDLYNHPEKYEIDHIIPRSIFPDDSLANKVLTKKENNQAKKKRPPYEWLQNDKEKWNMLTNLWKEQSKITGEYENWDLKFFPTEKISENSKEKFNRVLQTKLTYLLIEDLEDLREFLDRQLNDTRYATKAFVAALRKFFSVNKKNDSNSKVKIISTKAYITHFIRKWAKDQLFLSGKISKGAKDPIFDKEREKFYHHAIDASLVAFAGKYYLSWLFPDDIRGLTSAERKFIEVETGLIEDSIPSDQKEKYIEKLFDKFGNEININWDWSKQKNLKKL